MWTFLCVIALSLVQPAWCSLYSSYGLDPVQSPLSTNTSLRGNSSSTTLSAYTNSAPSTSSSDHVQSTETRDNATSTRHKIPPTITGTAPDNHSAPTNASLCFPTKVQPGQFPFKIPYDATQSCDIFGPACQPGSITVEAAAAAPTECQNGSSLITLPCSSYLTSQSSYLERYRDDQYRYPLEWGKKFGRAEKCRSYQSFFSAANGTVPWTFSQCPGTQGSGGPITAPPSPSRLPRELPAGVSRWQKTWQWCCGQCIFDIPQVTVYYFRDDALDKLCHSRTGGIQQPNSTLVGRITGVSSGTKIAHQVRSIIPEVAGASTVIVSGHTLTSPSIYLEVGGTVTARDFCGPIGSTLTRPFIPLPKDGLSSVFPQKLLAGHTLDGSRTTTRFYPFNKNLDATRMELADVACPTYGVGLSTRSEDGFVFTTVGPPYLPLLVPPRQITSLDPEWSIQCHQRFAMLSRGVLDPPKVLAIESSLGPANPPVARPTARPSQVGEIVGSGMPAPGSGINADQPLQTGTSGVTGSTVLKPRPGGLVEDSARHDSGGADDGAEKTKADSTTSSEEDQKDDDSSNNGESSAANDPSDNGGGNDREKSGNSNGDNAKANPENKSRKGNDGTSKSGNGQGGSSQNASEDDGENKPHNDDNDDQPSESASTVTKHLAEHDPEDKTNDPAENHSDEKSSNNPSKDNNASQQGDNGSNPSPSSPSSKPKPKSPANHLVLHAGGSAITVASQKLSLGPSQNLIIGDKTVAIASPPVTKNSLSPLGPSITSSPPSASIFSIGSHTFTADPTGFTLPFASTSIVPGGPGATVSGTRVSLNLDGVLIIDGSSTSLHIAAQATTSELDKAAAATSPPGKPGEGGEYTSMPMQILTPGGPAILIDGATVSLDPEGKRIVVGGKTVDLSTDATAAAGRAKATATSPKSSTNAAATAAVTSTAGDGGGGGKGVGEGEETGSEGVPTTTNNGADATASPSGSGSSSAVGVSVGSAVNSALASNGASGHFSHLMGFRGLGSLLFVFGFIHLV